ncbi:hypothetical protein CF70_034915 [Cupriavidus sp. SK-3]|nr:hypothetical protein [Cupriavidus sp. SK-3]KDP87706.1 hypothetical protein CF70_034915 [Cupriavidus sp. SK-3]
MLSPHEVATLMLIKDAPLHTELDRADLDTLLEQQLVNLEEFVCGHRRPRITARGNAVLNAMARIR